MKPLTKSIWRRIFVVGFGLIFILGNYFFLPNFWSIVNIIIGVLFIIGGLVLPDKK